MTPSLASGSRAAAILRAAHAEPGITRAALVRTLGLSSGLATDTVARLVNSRLLAEVPAPASGSRGRPTQSLVAHPEGPLVAAVAISHDRWDVAMVALGGAVIERTGAAHAGDWSAVRRGVRRRLGAARPARGTAGRGERVGAGHGERAPARSGPDPRLGRDRPAGRSPGDGAARVALVRSGQRRHPGRAGRGAAGQCPRSAHGGLPAHGQRSGRGAAARWPAHHRRAGTGR